MLIDPVLSVFRARQEPAPQGSLARASKLIEPGGEVNLNLNSQVTGISDTGAGKPCPVTSIETK